MKPPQAIQARLAHQAIMATVDRLMDGMGLDDSTRAAVGFGMAYGITMGELDQDTARQLATMLASDPVMTGRHARARDAADYLRGQLVAIHDGR